MLKTLALIAMNWTVRDQDLSHVRCVRCHEIHSEGPGGGAFRVMATITMTRTDDGMAVTDSLQTPAEWMCPCGRQAPLELGELLVNDTTVSCRRRWVCRNRWRVPAEAKQIICPCCWTDQPGPAGWRASGHAH